MQEAGTKIATILRHDDKRTSYKIALIRAINDIALMHPGLNPGPRFVAIPLRQLAERWVAYYWPFVSSHKTILQGHEIERGGKTIADMSFRGQLTDWRQAWEKSNNLKISNGAEGYIAVEMMRIPRKAKTYPASLAKDYKKLLTAISKAVRYPIQYAGPRGKEWSEFVRPARLKDLGDRAYPLPTAAENDLCLLLDPATWASFRELSLWVESLCVVEWARFTAGLAHPDGLKVSVGDAFSLLTKVPQVRKLLHWERDQVNALLKTGSTFTCPWTKTLIEHKTKYALDHIVPIAMYPINALWNLVPSEPDFNSHKKRDRLPTEARMDGALQALVDTYKAYLGSPDLKEALIADSEGWFVDVDPSSTYFPDQLAVAVSLLVMSIGDARNTARF